MKKILKWMKDHLIICWDTIFIAILRGLLFVSKFVIIPAVAIIGFFTLIVLFRLMELITLFLRALTLKYLWQWFVVPTFGGSPLSFFISFGLMLVVFFITPIRWWGYRNVLKEAKHAEDILEACKRDDIKSIIKIKLCEVSPIYLFYQLIPLFLGYAIHIFM